MVCKLDTTKFITSKLASSEVYISSKKMKTRTYFQEKLRDHIHDVIYRPTYQGVICRVSFQDFFSKCDQIRRFLRIWSHLLKKPSMENFIFCAVTSLKSDVSKLKRRVVTVFLENLWSEKFIQKTSSHFKYIWIWIHINNIQTEFPQSGIYRG